MYSIVYIYSIGMIVLICENWTHEMLKNAYPLKLNPLKTSLHYCVLILWLLIELWFIESLGERE